MRRDYIEAVCESLKEHKLKFDLLGEERDLIRLDISMENRDPVRVLIAFAKEDTPDIKIRAVDITKFAEDRVNRMYSVCNEMNSKYRFVKFIVNEANHTLSADADFFCELSECGELAFRYLVKMMAILEKAYPVVQKTLWA